MYYKKMFPTVLLLALSSAVLVVSANKFIMDYSRHYQYYNQQPPDEIKLYCADAKTRYVIENALFFRNDDPITSPYSISRSLEGQFTCGSNSERSDPPRKIVGKLHSLIH